VLDHEWGQALVSRLRAINAFWEKPVMARSHIKLWWGDLVIGDRTSPVREEQHGEVSAFTIGNTRFAWWPNEQLRRRQQKESRSASHHLADFAVNDTKDDNPVMARSHLKLWWGDLVISKRRTSPHREEQYGEVLAFRLGDTRFAWWPNEQLRRLAERRQQDRKVDNYWWNRIKTPYVALVLLIALTLAGAGVWSISIMQAHLLTVRSYQLGQELLLLDQFINQNKKDQQELDAMYARAYVLVDQLNVALDPRTQPLGQLGLISLIPFGSRTFLTMLEQRHGIAAGVAFRIGYGTQEILEISTALTESENQEKGSEELKQDMMASSNDKIRWHMEYFWADAEKVGFPTFSLPQSTENVVDDRRRLTEAYSEYVSRLTKFLYPYGSGCAVRTTLFCVRGTDRN
jgi:hypothetical protein